MISAVAFISRGTAMQLVGTYGPEIVTGVESELGRSTDVAKRYTDPIAIAGLIVSISALVWTVFNDLRKSGEDEARQQMTLVATVKIQLGQTVFDDTTVESIVEIAAGEATKLARANPQDHDSR